MADRKSQKGADAMSHFYCIFVPEIAHCSPSVPKCTTFLLTALKKITNKYNMRIKQLELA